MKNLTVRAVVLAVALCAVLATAVCGFLYFRFGREAPAEMTPPAAYTLGAFDAMLRMLEELAERRFMSKNCLELYFVADTPERAMEYLAGYVPRKGSIRRLEDYNK